MRITKRICDARGSAVVEFIVIAVGIMVPVGYLIVAVASVLGAQAAAQHAVREAGPARHRINRHDTQAGAEGMGHEISSARLRYRIV